MLKKLGSTLMHFHQWVLDEHGGVMDELITQVGFWIFSSIAVMVTAGLIWGAMSGDVQDMVGVLKNLF